jgi:hypothetical protein
MANETADATVAAALLRLERALFEAARILDERHDPARTEMDEP